MVDTATVRRLANELPHMDTKEMLLEAAPDRFFTDDHYRGYPAILVRLPQIEEDELRGLFRTAWRIMAPKALQGALPPES